MKVFLVSLGCSKNLVDSEMMLGFLKRAGFLLADNLQQAEIAIVNTCAFIKEAKQESIDTVFELVQLKKKKKLKSIIVAGCLPQRYKYSLLELLPEVDGFLGIGSIDKIKEVISQSLDKKHPFFDDKPHHWKTFKERIFLTPEHYAYLKVADGCDNRCSYCVIPQIRGRYCSRPIETVVNEAKFLVERGVKEINLISQDTTLYGRDIYGQTKLNELLLKLTKIKDLKWLRILYAHPKHFKRSLLEIIAQEPKICKYIDLPIQHINDKILQVMQRKVDSSTIKQLIALLRKVVPNIALRTSVIVGFPGETEKNFKELYDFVSNVRFDRLGVFKYSAEENTKAAKMRPQLPEKEKENRLKKIMLLQQKIIREKNNGLIGKKMDVLIDELSSKHEAIGRTQFDAPEVDGLVFVKGQNLKTGDLIKVKMTDSYVYDLVGEKL